MSDDRSIMDRLPEQCQTCFDLIDGHLCNTDAPFESHDFYNPVGRLNFDDAEHELCPNYRPNCKHDGI